MLFCKTLKRTIHIFVGMIIGFLITSQFGSLNYENFKKGVFFQLCSYQINAKQYINPNQYESKNGNNFINKRTFSVIQNLSHLNNSTKVRKLLLIGVLTAKQFIDSRALTIYKTWAKDVDGHIIFFSSENSRYNINILLLILFVYFYLIFFL